VVIVLASEAVSPARGQTLLPALPTVTTVGMGAEGSAQLYLNPSTPGLNQLHLFIYPTRPRAPVTGVRVTAGRPGGRPQLVRSVRIASHHYIQYVLLGPGTWRFHVALRVGGRRESFAISRIVP
jgi:hypothetical protein